MIKFADFLELGQGARAASLQACIRNYRARPAHLNLGMHVFGQVAPRLYKNNPIASLQAHFT